MHILLYVLGWICHLQKVTQRMYTPIAQPQMKYKLYFTIKIQYEEKKKRTDFCRFLGAKVIKMFGIQMFRFTVFLSSFEERLKVLKFTNCFPYLLHIAKCMLKEVSMLQTSSYAIIIEFNLNYSREINYFEIVWFLIYMFGRAQMAFIIIVQLSF